MADFHFFNIYDTYISILAPPVNRKVVKIYLLTEYHHQYQAKTIFQKDIAPDKESIFLSGNKSIIDIKLPIEVDIWSC